MRMLCWNAVTLCFLFCGTSFSVNDVVKKLV